MVVECWIVCHKFRLFISLRPARRRIKGAIKFTFISSKYKAFLIIRIYTLPVNSQSYATAASTTGTILEPSASVKPFTVIFLSCVEMMYAFFPTTGESA